MYFVQFFQLSTGHSDGVRKPIEACGDRAVVILDGRESLNTMHEFSERECNKRGYIGWQLFKGPSFTRSTAISKPIIQTL